MSFKIFGEILCGKTLAQMHEAMSHDFAIEGALMPDAHAGYSLPIGGVVKTAGCVVPAWVGYDIGCGVAGHKTNIIKDDLTKEVLEEVKKLVIKRIPMGSARNHQRKAHELKHPRIVEMFTPLGQEIANTRGFGQLGTLGGGNHFLEVGYDEENWVWVSVHSGSRGVGHALATHYMRVAAADAGVTQGNVEGGYPLWQGTPTFDDYMQDLKAAITWAELNRATMLQIVMDAFSEVLGGEKVIAKQSINGTHNTAFDVGDNQFVHRKGATAAGVGEYGIIPGNMRDGFFVAKGLGNSDSMESSSHGAGRVMSRAEAKVNIDFDIFQKQMEHVVTNIAVHTIDEAPAAYKNIFDVMDSQKDCVDIVHHVKPLLNLKG